MYAKLHARLDRALARFMSEDVDKCVRIAQKWLLWFEARYPEEVNWK